MLVHHIATFYHSTCIVVCRYELHVGTLHCNFMHYEFWPYLNLLLEQQIKLVLSLQFRKFSSAKLSYDKYVKDDYARWRPRAVCLSCSFHHDPLRHQLLYLTRYEAHFHKLALNSFPEPVYLILKPYELK